MKLWGKRLLPHSQLPHSQILQKKAELCCLPGSSSRQQSAQGRQTGKARVSGATPPPLYCESRCYHRASYGPQGSPHFHHLPFKGWGPMGQCFPPGSCGPSSSSAFDHRHITIYTIYTCIDARRQSYPACLTTRAQACRRLPSAPALRSSH